MLTKIEPIAIYAAVLSTIVFIWTFLYGFGPAPGLKVSASSNMNTFGTVFRMKQR
jgi:hypothetical protein